MMYDDPLKIRKGSIEDIDKIYQLVEEQAIHHKVELDDVKNTAEQMRQDAFGEDAFFKFLVAEHDGEVVGTAIYYFTYSTWKGKSLYLEDLIVKQGMRGLGIGQKLFEALAQEGERLNVSKVTWQVAEDNTKAIRFYERFDADFDEEWIYCTLESHQLEAISSSVEEHEAVPA